MNRRQRFVPAVFTLFALIFALTAANSLVAQSAPRLTAMSPEWIQRGTNIEITLTGENLAAVTHFIVSGDSGISVTNVPLPAPPPPSSVTVESTSGAVTRAEVSTPARDDKKLVIKVTAVPEATLSARELRVLSPGGVSNPLNLNVGQWREVASRDGINALADAQMVEWPAVISGAIKAAAQTNYYRFKARKGEELIFDVEAARRGSPLDSSISVLDVNGRELARNEDATSLDSLLFFTVPADGEFILSLRDFRFRGGGDYAYRLTAGPIPYVESVFPFGGQRGKNVEVSLTGRNLDGTTKLALALSPRAPRTQEIRVKTPRGHSNLIPFTVSDVNEVMEAEPNNEIDKAQSVTVPVVINGRIQDAGDLDRFRFRSETDQKLAFDVAASRFGSRLDALLILMDTNGTVLAQNDDAAGSDARLEFDAKKGVEYIVTLRDLTDRGGDRFGYRLAIRPPSAAAGPSFVARYLPDAARVHRAGTATVRCEVTRAGGFEGPVRFTVEDLPSGVFAEPLVIPNAPHSGLLLISAAKDAPLGSFPIRVNASGMIGGKTVVVAAEPVSGDRGTRQGYLTILDTVPFSLDATTLSLGLEQNQGGTIEVFAQRQEGFSGEIKLVTEGFNVGREGLGKSFSGGEGTIKAGENIGRISLTPKMESELGLRTVIVRGESTVDGRKVVTSSRALPIVVTAYPLILSSTLPRLSLAVLPPGSTSAAGEAETKIRVDRRGGFGGDVELTLEGLPEGVRSELPKIPAGVGEVALKLFVTDKAKLGTNYNVTVVGTALFNDKNYKARTPKIGLTIGIPEIMEIATNAVPARAESGTK